MLKLKNSQKIFSFLLFLFLILPLSSFALVLQLRYPMIELPGIRAFDLNVNITLHELSRYIYYFFVVIGGVAAFAGLIYGGFQWLISAGNPVRVSVARDQILASFLGIILLLSSWVILYTIDPQFVVLPVYAPAAPTTPPPQEYQLPILTDGYAFTITNDQGDEVMQLPQDKGGLMVNDTHSFLYLGGSIDLSGEGRDGLRLQRVTFFNPWDLATCDVDPATSQITAGSCETLYYHGLVCFSETNFTGFAKVCASITGDTTCETQFPNADPCLSFISFKQPRIPVYVSGDEIIFYETPSPPKKNLQTGEIIDRACLKINENARPENCRISCSLLRSGGGVFRIENQNCHLERGLPGIIGIQNLRGESINENGDTRHWWPMSMLATVGKAKKYLVLLFNTTNEFQVGHDDDFGAIYGQTYAFYLEGNDVPNFGDSSDPQLYWVRQPGDEERVKPKSLLILPLQPLE